MSLLSMVQTAVKKPNDKPETFTPFSLQPFTLPTATVETLTEPLSDTLDEIGVKSGTILTNLGTYNTKKKNYDDTIKLSDYEYPIVPVSYTHLTLPTIYSV